MRKVYIGVGHGGRDSGAIGYLIEKEVNLKMAKACRDYLVARGVDAKMSRTTDVTQDLTDKINACNAFKPDLALDVHSNAGGGDGFEVYYSIVGGMSKTLAKNIEAEVIKIGQNSRGLKTKVNDRGTDYFGFIRQTTCPAVICEAVFVDNKADAAQADTDEECKAFGEAYAKGILKTLDIEDKEEKPSIPSEDRGYLVKVTANALNIRAGAGIGYKVNGVIYDKGVYTIVETKRADGYTWGKLKSGAGWIALEYTKKV